MKITPIDNMIARVARAILKARFYDYEPGAYDNDLEKFFRVVDQDHVEDAEYEARAAVAAMREPDPIMLAHALPSRDIEIDKEAVLLCERACHILEPNGFPAKGHADGMHAAQQLLADWRNMVDAALETPSRPKRLWAVG